MPTDGMTGRRRAAGAILVLVLLGAWYAIGVGRGFALTTADDFGYASVTVGLSRGTPLVHQLDSPAFASQLVPVDGHPGAYASKFPFGTSLLLVPFYLAGGFRALFALGPLLAVLGVVALYDLARQLARQRSTALLAGGLAATLPPLVMFASDIGSDLTSLTFVTAALAVYARHVDRPRPARFWLFAFLAGAAFLVRNPNALLVAAVGVHELVVHRGRMRPQLAAWIGGALVFLAFVALQLAWNVAIFGTLVGGYEHEAQRGFALHFVPAHLPGYLVVLCMVPPLGLPAMLAVLAGRGAGPRSVHRLLAGLVLLYVGLYSSWWSFDFDPLHRPFLTGGRFVLPILPVMCVFVAVALESIASARARRLLAAAVVATQVAASTVLTVQLWRYKNRMAEHRDQIYAATAPRALVIGPEEWSKLLFTGDGSGSERRYAAFEGARWAARPDDELPRLVDATLRAGEPAYLLGSGRRANAAEQRAAAVLHARYAAVTLVDTDRPYDLKIERLQSP
jgi:hypothetical protein